MNKLTSLLLLIVGILLIVCGINTADSIGSNLARFFTGSPTDKSMWLFIGGSAAAIIGASGLVLRGAKHSN